MSEFRTIIDTPKSKFVLSYHTKSLFIGSCFTESIGNKLEELKFPVDINPFGIVYNPASIKSCLEILINKKLFKKEDLQFHNEQWFSFSHHGRFSNTNADECLKNINERIKSSSEFLKNSEFLFITLGTAWIYKLKATGKTVANCHKLPENNFEKKILSVEEIVEEYKTLINSLMKFNPKLIIIFTVSPVRHWKDGAFGNQVSKATLLLAVNKLLGLFKNSEYFPSYEILMDDLRDYRFYADDMLHPNNIAVNYIFGKFSEMFFDEKTMKIISEIEKIIKAKNHRPFDNTTVSYKNFIKEYRSKINLILSDYPFLNLEEEKRFFSK
ncbi:MAG: GSCFA domain-containing protein [Bacteroidales bacterium]|nr:GSCFA domain-containing protein [Bacteroidales bacterium]